MPSKRPAPLSDAALFSGKAAAAAGPAAAPGGPLGETNDGVPLPVKNTFIDVPSGLTPSHMQSASARNQMLNTAPAELNVATGFIKRSILASSVGPTVAAVEAATSVAQPIGSLSPVPASPQAVSLATPVSPTKRGLAGVVQRPVLPEKSAVPGSSHGYTPMMTPSPTGSSLFTVHRYQLFGGPAPVTEATHSALAPGGFVGSYSAGLTGPLSPTRQLPSGPLTAAAAASSQTAMASASSLPVTTSWPASIATQGATQMSTFSSSVPIISAGTYSRPAHAAALQTEQMQQLKEREGEDDEDDSDDEEAQQQAQQQGSGAAKTPEEAPKPPPGAEHPSLGSAEHDAGTCKRCCFFPRNRCLNGYNCDFCHYDHEKRKRKSKKKKKKDKAADGALGAFETLGTSMAVGLPMTAPPSATMQLSSLSTPTVAAPAHMAALPTHPVGSLMAAPAEPPPPLGMPTLAPSLGLDGFYEYGASGALAHQFAPSSAVAGAFQAGAASTSPALATTVSAPSYFAPATGSTAQSAIESQRVVLPASEPVHHLLGTNPQAARYVLPSGGEVAQALYSAPPVQTYAPQQVAYPATAEPHALSAGPPLYEATVPSAPTLVHSATAVSSTLPAHAPPSGPPALITSSVYKPPAAPPVMQPAGPWAPPIEAPNLPQGVQFGEDMAPPPPEAPRAFPPTPNAMAPAASLVQAAGGPKAPPPMCSPKLTKNMVLTLQAQTQSLPPGT